MQETPGEKPYKEASGGKPWELKQVKENLVTACDKSGDYRGTGMAKAQNLQSTWENDEAELKPGVRSLDYELEIMKVIQIWDMIWYDMIDEIWW